jgi:hypothetical protein
VEVKDSFWPVHACGGGAGGASAPPPAPAGSGTPAETAASTPGHPLAVSPPVEWLSPVIASSAVVGILAAAVAARFLAPIPPSPPVPVPPASAPGYGEEFREEAGPVLCVL